MLIAESSIVNSLTIDVEDYFHVSAFESVSPPETWGSRESRVEGNTIKILNLLAERRVLATFFILAWVAERFPDLVKRVAADGHEVASHGYGHGRVYTQTREQFREDVRRSKGLLEDLTGRPISGYRAPSYSISPTCLWAFDELLEAGYTYDSSVFPVRHDLYGLSDWPRFPFAVERMGDGNWVPSEAKPRSSGFDVPSPTLNSSSGRAEPGTRNSEQLLEVPITTLNLFGRSWPVAGGGYFRLFPYGFTRRALRRINCADRRPFVFYLHPWELDPAQPRMAGAPLKSRMRHYLNLSRTEARFRHLLADFRFGPIRASL